MSWALVLVAFWQTQNFCIFQPTEFEFDVTESHVDVSKQQHELRNNCFKIMENLSIQETYIFDICSLAHVLQSYLVGVSGICQSLA